MPVREIAVKLKVSEKTIKRRLSENGTKIRAKYYGESDEIEKIVGDAVKRNDFIGKCNVIGRWIYRPIMISAIEWRFRFLIYRFSRSYL